MLLGATTLNATAKTSEILLRQPDLGLVLAGQVVDDPQPGEFSPVHGQCLLSLLLSVCGFYGRYVPQIERRPLLTHEQAQERSTLRSPPSKW